MYRSKSFLSDNRHIHTIIPALFFDSSYQYLRREKFILTDGDFIHVDWGLKRSKKLVLMLHGLESSTDQFYMRHSAQYLESKGFSIAAMNYRGCSGIPNSLFKGYHSGCSYDLKDVINSIVHEYNFEELYLLGFSLGGNIVLKYLAENPEDKFTQKGIAFSSPVDLKSAAIQIGDTFGGIYEKRFMDRLKQGLQLKSKLHPEEDVDIDQLMNMKKFAEFDDYYTAPANGFLNADDYYQKASSLYLMNHITIPSLLVSAYDDPFLPSKCYPQNTDSKAFKTEYHSKGGHLAFVKNFWKQTCWYPQRAAEFFMQ